MALVATKKQDRKLTQKQPLVYTDFPTTMERSVGSGDVQQLFNVEAVKNSIRNIVLTNKGERFFNLEFGCDVRSLLFDNVDAGTEAALQSTIETAISNFEPRANLINVIVSGQPDINAYTITVVFSTINSPEPQTLDLILTRIR